MRTAFVLLLVAVFFQPWPDDAVFGREALWLSEFAKLAVLGAVSGLLLLRRSPAVLAPVEGTLLLVYGMVICGALILNVEISGARDYVEFARPLFLLLLLFTFMNIPGPWKAGWFLKFLVVFGLIQVFVALAQLVIPEQITNSIGSIYRTTKVEVSELRATGTLGNPNIMAIVLIAALCANVVMPGWGLAKKSAYSLVLGAGIFASGSLLAVPLAGVGLALPFIFSGRSTVDNLAGKGLLLLVTPALAVLFAAVGAEYLPRLERLAVLAEPGGIWELRNLALRLEHWGALYHEFASGPWYRWVFGISSAKSEGFSVVDNEYLFTFFRYGIIGFILYYAIFARFAYVFYRNLPSPLAVFGLTTLCVLGISGLFYETYSSLRFIPLYMIPIAILLSERTETQAINVIAEERYEQA